MQEHDGAGFGLIYVMSTLWICQC